MINLASNLTRWEDKTDPSGKSRPRMLCVPYLQVNCIAVVLFPLLTIVSSWTYSRLQIHDEAIFELRLNETDIKQLQEISRLSCCNDCEKFFKLKVPLLLNCSAGVNWAAMKEIWGARRYSYQSWLHSATQSSSNLSPEETAIWWKRSALGRNEGDLNTSVANFRME